MDNIIEIVHLQKKYELYDKPIDRLKEAINFTKKTYHTDFYALRDISLTIKAGDCVGIVGVNGSGKSTLLKLITGVLTPTAGEIITRGKVAALLELGAGFNPEYTGRENIFLNGTMMGYSEKEMEMRVQPIIDFADIGSFIDQPVKMYSSGMFARLAFAVAINVNPDILIVDEALSVGDTRFQMKCIEKMKELRDKGTTILFVSHATEQIKRFCTRTIWIRDGLVFRDGEASQIVDLYDNFMKFGDSILTQNTQHEENIDMPEQDVFETNASEKNLPAFIRNVSINQKVFHTFDTLEIDVQYSILDPEIDGFLLGVAIYSKDRENYIFGPNTFLDKKKIPAKKGRYSLTYTIPKLQLISGEYVIDVGIFNNEGIVNLDYKMNALEFAVSNLYFSEGLFYMEHEWNVREENSND